MTESHTRSDGKPTGAARTRTQWDSRMESVSSFLDRDDPLSFLKRWDEPDRPDSRSPGQSVRSSDGETRQHERLQAWQVTPDANVDRPTHQPWWKMGICWNLLAVAVILAVLWAFAGWMLAGIALGVGCYLASVLMR